VLAGLSGGGEWPAGSACEKTKCGAVQFRCYTFNDRVEDGHLIIQGAIDEGQVVELKLPKGWDVVFVKRAPKKCKPVACANGANAEIGDPGNGKATK
jgi:hypothetical protein